MGSYGWALELFSVIIIVEREWRRDGAQQHQNGGFQICEQTGRYLYEVYNNNIKEEKKRIYIKVVCRRAALIMYNDQP